MTIDGYLFKFNTVSLPVPPSKFRFNDAETYMYRGNIRIENTRLYQFLSSNSVGFATAENVTGVTFLKGQVIGRSVTLDKGYVLADNSAVASQAIGLCADGAKNGAGTIIQMVGVFVLADWTPVIGAATLAARTVYYLSATPGMLTAVVPVGPAIIQKVGRSLSPSVLSLNLDIL